MVLPWLFSTTRRLVLRVAIGVGEFLLRPLLTSVSTIRVASIAPSFGQALLTGTLHRSPQIRACTVPAQAPHLPPPRFRIGFALSSTLAWSRRPRMRLLFVTWQVLARMWRSGMIDRLTSTFAGFLPTVGRPSAVAFASCLFLTSYPSGMMTPKEVSELNTGDWSS